MSSATFTITGTYALVFKMTNDSVIRFTFLIAALFVLVALALAWRDEHETLLAEVEKNSSPIFYMEVEQVRHSTSNYSLLLKCAITNTSRTAAGVRSAILSDRHLGSPVLLRANELLATFEVFDLHAPKTFTMSIVDEFLTKMESVPKIKVSNLIVDSPILLQKGQREVGWLAFERVAEVDPYDALRSNQFSLTVIDTLGTKHGPLEMISPISEVFAVGR